MRSQGEGKGLLASGCRCADMRSSGTLSRDEKLDYIRAVKCLRSLPPRTPANVSAGAVSRVSLPPTVQYSQRRCPPADAGISSTTSPWYTSSRHSPFITLGTLCRGTGGLSTCMRRL